MYRSESLIFIQTNTSNFLKPYKFDYISPSQCGTDGEKNVKICVKETETVIIADQRPSCFTIPFLPGPNCPYFIPINICSSVAPRSTCAVIVREHLNTRGIITAV